MTSQTKVGLVLSLGVVLVVCIVISDHRANSKRPVAPQELTAFANRNMTNQPDVLYNRVPVAPAENTVYTEPGPRTNSLPLESGAVVESLQGQPFSDNPAGANPVVPTENTDAAGTVDGEQQPAVPSRSSLEEIGRAAERALAQPELGANTSQVLETQAHPSSSDMIYEIKAGDTLSEISYVTLGTSTRWREILKANNLKSDRDLRIGMKLRIPGGAMPVATAGSPSASQIRVHLVVAGDNLGSISQKYLGTSRRWKEIQELNNLSSPNALQVGMELKIPVR